MGESVHTRFRRTVAEEVAGLANKIVAGLPYSNPVQFRFGSRFYKLEAWDIDLEGEQLIFKLWKYGGAWGDPVVPFMVGVMGLVMRETNFCNWRIWKPEANQIMFDLFSFKTPLDLEIEANGVKSNGN